MKMVEQPAKPHYHGHRARLRQRFLQGGPGALQDYELLELLLTFAIPYSDVKPLAKRVIEHFGSFTQVLDASPEALMEVTGSRSTPPSSSAWSKPAPNTPSNPRPSSARRSSPWTTWWNTAAPPWGASLTSSSG